MHRAIACLILTCAVPAAAQVDFDRQLKPVFEAKCLRCHNPNISKSELSLADLSKLTSGENAILVPGEPAQSLLLTAVTPESAGERPYMPEDGEPLTADEVQLLRQWITEGAKWPEGLVLREASKSDKSWWAYQKLKTPELKSIDAYVDRKLAAVGLKRNERADRRTLIRRATYDLIGLPPTPEEVDAFVQDESPDAFAKVVDRLLASPHYGERWGRHWLDVVRFGESNGFERNFLITNLWPFRDYVIKSINDDKPFDQFIREHIAGDIIGKGDPDVAIGSAFLVAGPYDDVGNQDAAAAAQIRANTLDEIINATSSAFLGMTVGCARCHDHKFDPILQRDYYQLYATFAGVRHGAATIETSEQATSRNKNLKPLNAQKALLDKQIADVDAAVLARANAKIAEYQARWTRSKVDRTGTEDKFKPVVAKFVRFTSEAGDANPRDRNFNLDEFEVWSSGANPRNVALSANGGKATGRARRIEDFDGAYSPELVIDGKSGARFLSISPTLTIELAQRTKIDRVVFSSARGERIPQHSLFRFVADYRIEVSTDGKAWQEVASGRNRKPVNNGHRRHRFLTQEITPDERKQQAKLRRELNKVKTEIAKHPAPAPVWIGSRSANDAKGPFHVFVGGNPQRKGGVVTSASLSTLSEVTPTHELGAEVNESGRRKTMADWITLPENPLTPRVLANRMWHYHFGTGIVDTPNDFGYMGGRPTHPELLDFLATTLQENGWRLKPMHRMIMLSQAYQQSSTYEAGAAKVDGDSRLLWRFPPRRLSAEEIRDTMLTVAGKLNNKMGGPGFRLYKYMQDNVSTYEPLDAHGPETYRRAVYHHNARASIVDLMTEYDQPDCAFSSPRRAQTTTPLQALTMLNHKFTLDMADALAARVEQSEPKGVSSRAESQVDELFRLTLQRSPADEERRQLSAAIKQTNLRAVCRAVLNSSELIYVD